MRRFWSFVFHKLCACAPGVQVQDSWTSFQNVAPTIPTMQRLKWVPLSWQLPLEPQKASHYFPPPPRLGGVTVQLYNYCSCLRSQINLNLKIPWQILAGFDLEGKLRCHSFCQSFLITEDDWLGHGSCPDNTAAAFRAAKANRYTVMYLASDSFQPQISKGKNDFFIRFQRPIESISMNRWVKS